MDGIQQPRDGYVTHFARCVQEGRTEVAPGASLREGLAQVAVSEGAYRSSNEGKPSPSRFKSPDLKG